MTNNVVRPKLSIIAPLLNSNVVMFIWLNPFLGYAILVQAPNPALVVMNSYALTYIWSGFFFALSLVLLYGKLTNNWNLLKGTLSAGLFVKAVITYSLIVLGLKTGFNNIVGVTSLWVAVTWVQFYTVRHFKVPGGRYAK